MKFHRIVTMALVASLVAAGVPLFTGAVTPDQTELRSIADAELSAVTGEIDKANIFFSPADDGDEPNFPKVVHYQREYLAGRQSFDDGNTATHCSIYAMWTKLFAVTLAGPPDS
jgi:hypothetical protein